MHTRIVSVETVTGKGTTQQSGRNIIKELSLSTGGNGKKKVTAEAGPKIMVPKTINMSYDPFMKRKKKASRNKSTNYS